MLSREDYCERRFKNSIMEFPLLIAMVVLSVSLTVESNVQDMINSGYSPIIYGDFLKDDLPMAMSELNPLFLYSNSGDFRRLQQYHQIPNRSFHMNNRAVSTPDPSSRLKSSESSRNQRYNDNHKTEQRGRFRSPRQFEQIVGSSSNRIRPQESVRSQTRYEMPGNSFNRYYRTLRVNNIPHQQNPNGQNFVKYDDEDDDEEDRHTDGKYIVRIHQPNPTKNTRKQNSKPTKNTISHNFYNARERKQKPSYRQPFFEMPAPKMVTYEDAHGVRGNVGTDPIVVLPSPRLTRGHEQRTVLLMKKQSILVTTKRPESAPRGFRTRPQYIEHATNPPNPTLPPTIQTLKPFTSGGTTNVAKHRDVYMHNIRDLVTNADLSSLDAEGSHRLEQSDQNLYYKSDPFLDITEVYSLPRNKSYSYQVLSIPRNTTKDDKSTRTIPGPLYADRNQHYKKDPSVGITVSYSKVGNATKIDTPVRTRNKLRQPLKSDTDLHYKNNTSSSISEAFSFNATRPGLFRTRPDYSSTSSLDKKLDDRKHQLKTHRKMTLKKSLLKKLKEEEDASSIPGKPGSDYPTYQEVPFTNFDCRDVKSTGFYADMEAGCQVFHNCDAEMQRHSFLCPNGTIFRQELLICDWWYNVRCDDARDFFPPQLT